jgi:hypothetical protein
MRATRWRAMTAPIQFQTAKFAGMTVWTPAFAGATKGLVFFILHRN